MAVYRRLLKAYGRQEWWPADSNFEIMTGAILTQNTAWTNVKKAIANLKDADILAPEKILACKDRRLAELIRPSGYFNIKSDRLKNLCRWLIEHGGEAALAKTDTVTLRDSLLQINGVGPETADDILLYVFCRQVFVIDTYTRRLFSRLNLIQGDEPYELLRQSFESVLPADFELYQQYHALIVLHAKQKCSQDRACKHCYAEGYKAG